MKAHPRKKTIEQQYAEWREAMAIGLLIAGPSYPELTARGAWLAVRLT